MFLSLMALTVQTMAVTNRLVNAERTTMLIEINTADMTAPEALALAALLTSLATGTALTSGTVAAPPPPTPPAATAIPAPAPTTPAAAAESLMALAGANATPAVAGETAITNADGTPKKDKEGLPWDARIHSSNQKQTAKGVWVAVRNLDPATNAQVRAELHAALGAPAIPMGTNPAPLPPAANPAPLPPPAEFQQQVTPTPTPQPIVEASTYAAATFPELMLRVVDVQTFGLLTPEEVTARCVALGLSQVRDFAIRTDLIPAMMASLPVPANG